MSTKHLCSADLVGRKFFSWHLPWNAFTSLLIFFRDNSIGCSSHSWQVFILRASHILLFYSFCFLCGEIRHEFCLLLLRGESFFLSGTFNIVCFLTLTSWEQRVLEWISSQFRFIGVLAASVLVFMSFPLCIDWPDFLRRSLCLTSPLPLLPHGYLCFVALSFPRVLACCSDGCLFIFLFIDVWMEYFFLSAAENLSPRCRHESRNS